jgi:exopolyphosphatase/guanosine-5'-triphosphate,3'-diphosphate pyrophosphatase
VRALETFGISGALSDDEVRMVRRTVRTLVEPFAQRHRERTQGALAAVSGGNPDTLASILGTRDALGMPCIEVRELRELALRIAAMDHAARMASFDVRGDRADVMGVAAIVIAAVGRSFGLRRLLVPGVGIREGILLELADGLVGEWATATEATHRALISTAWRFASGLGHDLTHGSQVRRLARSLFEQVGAALGIDEDAGIVLEVAALLHDVGEVVNRKGHHRHGEYLVLAARLPGLHSPQREMVAALVRAHRGSDPDPDRHPAFAALDTAERQTVRKLAGLLRLADAFDTDHRQRVVSLEATVSNRALRVMLRVEPPPSGAFAVRKPELFERVFGKSVEVHVGPAGAGSRSSVVAVS